MSYKSRRNNQNNKKKGNQSTYATKYDNLKPIKPPDPEIITPDIIQPPVEGIQPVSTLIDDMQPSDINIETVTPQVLSTITPLEEDIQPVIPPDINIQTPVIPPVNDMQPTDNSIVTPPDPLDQYLIPTNDYDITPHDIDMSNIRFTYTSTHDTDVITPEYTCHNVCSSHDHMKSTHDNMTTPSYKHCSHDSENDYMKFIVDPPKPKPKYKTSGLFRLPTTKEMASTVKHYIKCVPHMPIIKEKISDTVGSVISIIPGKKLMSDTINMMKVPLQVYDNYMNSLTYDIGDPDY